DAVVAANKRVTVTGNVCLANDGKQKPSQALVSDGNAWWLGPHKLAINYSAAGTFVSSNPPYVWTGSKIGGSASGIDCGSWKDQAAPQGGSFGVATVSGQGWLDSQNGNQF